MIGDLQRAGRSDPATRGRSVGRTASIRRIGLAALLVSALAAADCAPQGEPARLPPGCASEPRPTHGRVVLIGLDGADWRILDRLEREGRVPTLARLRREGAWGVLRSEEPLLSPIVWTTIATGRSPLDHGIVGFLSVREGKTEPVRSDERRVRAFWNVLSDFGVSTGVVGWYASWPAERVCGFLVSDRAGVHQVASEAGPVSDAIAYPPDVAREVARIRDAVTERMGVPEASRFFARPEDGGPIAIAPEKLETFLGILRTSEIYRTVFPALVEEHEPVVSAVYFEGTDAVGHLFAEYQDPPLAGLDARASRALGPAFDRYYEYVDTIVNEIVAAVDPATTTVMVVSDHGFRSGADRPRISTSRHGIDEAPLWHRPEGVLLLWGRGVVPGRELPEAGIDDVLPTIFRLVGIPLSEELEGRPIDAALTADALARPVTGVPSYESGPEIERGAVTVSDDEEVLAKLRALGYVGGDVGSASGGPATVAGAEGQAGIPLNRYNLALMLLDHDRESEALEVLHALQRDVPDFPLGFVAEGVHLLETNRPQRAVEVLENGLRTAAGSGVLETTLGEAYLRVGRTDDATTMLTRAMAADPTDGRSAALLGGALVAERRFREAEPVLEIARTNAPKAPERAQACVDLAVIAEERGAIDRAASLYGEALREAPGFARALERFANLEMYRGRNREAIVLWERLLAVVGDRPTLLNAYARALAAVARRDDARDALRRSLAADPGQADVRRALRSLETSSAAR